MKNFSITKSSVPGFKVSGMAGGIKKNGKNDLALIVSDTPAVTAGVFTQNRVQAAPVILSRKQLNKSRIFRAVIVNSGNANACTGPQGMKDCRAVLKRLAKELNISSSKILSASTGIIGVPLPVDKILTAIPQLVNNLAPNNWSQTAKAIMTTDLVAKTSGVEYREQNRQIIVAGIAKGSGMIDPNMATMLAFIQSNAAIEEITLQAALKEAVDQTFNRITVDGECSTNDCVILMANGQAGNPVIRQGSPAYKRFANALTGVCRDLAIKIVEDGEGASKFVTVRVRGARSTKQAETVASSVANSNLVKTALFGADPNWGRILCAVGYAGVPFDPGRVDISLNALPLVKRGAPTANISQKALERSMKKKSIVIDIHLNSGNQSVEVYTCDLSYDYVKINAEYTT